MTDAATLRFRDLVADAFGLAFDEGKHGFLAEVAKRRAAARTQSVDDYLASLETDAFDGERDALVAQLTVGETYFFRNRDQFNAFTEVVLPERMRARGNARQLRFLSAGCATGEEAYSIAMTIAEEIASPPWKVDIRAIDLNAAALARAAAGRYTTWALRDTPEAARERWFARDGRDFVLAPEIRAAVRFSRGNLSADDADLLPPDFYDAIFCRNVLMYFTPSVLRAAVRRLTAALAPGGYLFLGSAETLRGLSQEFHLVHTNGTFYYRRKLEHETDAPLAYINVGARPLRPATAIDPTPAPAIGADWYEAIGSATRRVAALTTAPVPRPAATVAPPAVAPQPVAASWNLGQPLELLQRERFGDALAALDAMPAEARTDRDVLLLQAVLLVNGGQLAAAGEVCQQLLAEDELNAGANYVLALCFEGTGNRHVATTLELSVPLSLSSVEALVVEGGGVTATLPLDAVRHTLRLSPGDIHRSSGAESIVYDGRAAPLVSLARLLSSHSASARAGRPVSAVIVGGTAGYAAIGVDRLLGTADIVVRSLPELMRANAAVGGSSLNADGSPLLMLDVEGLVNAALAVRPTDKSQPRASRPLMVVDDSLTTRMLEQSILESAGYKVDVATSAEEALERARSADYALFLVDVEMPGMDGFGFIEEIRRDPELRDTPAILVTSLNAPEHKRRGEEVGAQGYVVKSEFDQGWLLGRIAELIA